MAIRKIKQKKTSIRRGVKRGATGRRRSQKKHVVEPEPGSDRLARLSPMELVSQMGGDLASVLPAKALDHKKGVMHGKNVYHAPFYRSPGCVEDMCSLDDLFVQGTEDNPQVRTTESEKKKSLAQACLNSLGVGMVERQTYEDYQSVMKTFDSLSEQGRFYVMESNMQTIRQYISSLFAERTGSGEDVGIDKLSVQEREKLVSLLKVLNPAYYQYIVKTDLLPVKVRVLVAEAMIDAGKLSNPVELLNMLLRYYNTPDPFYTAWHSQWLLRSKPDEYPSATRFLGEYGSWKFRITEARFSETSRGRYQEGENWDVEGTCAPLEMPMKPVLNEEKLQKTMQETFMDSFARPNMIKLVASETNPGPTLKIDKRYRDTTKYPEGAEGDEEYARDMFVEVMGRLLEIDGKTTREMLETKQNIPTIQNMEREEVPLEDSIDALRNTGKYNLVAKVFGGVLGPSIYYAFQDNWNLGSIGDKNLDMVGDLSETGFRPNGEQLGMFAHMLTMYMNRSETKMEDSMDCVRMYLNNIHHETNPTLRPTLSVGSARSILGFLQREAPYYLETYPDTFERGGNANAKLGDRVYAGVDAYREIDLSSNKARVVSIYEADMVLPSLEIEGTGRAGKYRICMITEVSEYTNVDNTDTPIERTTKFQIVWEDQTPGNQAGFAEECVTLDKMLMDGVWKGMKPGDTLAPELALPPASKPVTKEGEGEGEGEGEVSQPLEEDVVLEEVEIDVPPAKEETLMKKTEDAVENVVEDGLEELGAEIGDELSELVEEKVAKDEKTGNLGDSVSPAELDIEDLDIEMPVTEKGDNTEEKKVDIPMKSALKSRETGYQIKPATKTRRMMRYVAPKKTRKVRIDTTRNVSDDLMLDARGNPLRGVDDLPVPKDGAIALG
jgi:hypothetical protein